MPHLRVNREELDELYDFLLRHRDEVSGSLMDAVEVEAMRPQPDPVNLQELTRSYDRMVRGMQGPEHRAAVDTLLPERSSR